MLSPSDHVQMLVEMLRPGGAELARRWLACLMVAPSSEREAIVRSVENRMAELYLAQRSEREVQVAHPPEQREGYFEHKVTTYVVKDEPD